MKNFLIGIFLLISSAANAQISHETLNQLLQENVDVNGMVDYQSFKKDIASLNEYLNAQRLSPPNDNWSDNQKLAYWINIYNALTIKLITDYYPLKSIKDIGALIQIPMINTPWDIPLFELENKELSLNDIEHGIIRKEFDEPRIHFALVCAAISCPKLRNEAYQSDKLDEQLTDQTKTFLKDSKKNILTEKRLQLSNLFNWYGGDFRKAGSLQQFLNQYSDISIDPKAKISFMKYSWELNEQRSTD